MATQCKTRFKQIKMDEGASFTGTIPTFGGVDLATVDDINPFVTWIDPSLVVGMLGDRTIAEIDALTPSAGQSVVAGSAGTPAAPTSDVLAIGDIAEFDGTGWKKILDNVGAFVPVDTQVIGANDGTTLFAPLTTVTDNGAILTADGVGGWTSVAPSEGDATLIYGDASVNENSIYAAQGTGTPTTWVQVAGGVSVTSVTGGDGMNSSPTTGAVVVSVDPESSPSGDEKAVSVSATGVSYDISNNDGTYVVANGSGVLQGTIEIDEAFTPSVASVSGDVIGPAIAGLPIGDGYIHFELNGLPYNVGDAVKTDDVYFSSDGGTTAKALTAITTGDICYLGAGIPTDALDCGVYVFRALSA